MWPFPKCLVKWREPKQFVLRDLAAADQRRRPWVKPLGVLVCAALIMLLWGFAYLDPDKSPPHVLKAIGLSLLWGVLVVYVFPAIDRWCPSDVRIFTNRMTRFRTNLDSNFLWTDVASYSWVVEEGYCIMVVNRLRKRPIQFGVPNADTKERIDKTMSDLGIQQSDVVQEDEEVRAVVGGR